jgi:hypothetical protein
LLSFNNQLDTAVGQIAHKSRRFKSARHFARTIAKSNSLNPSRINHLRAFPHILFARDYKQTARRSRGWQ